MSFPVSRLRVNAQSFVPRSKGGGEAALLSACAADKAPDATPTPHQHPSPSLMDLPLDVLSSILAHLSNPRDVLSCGMACKQCLSLLAHAPCALNLSTSLAESGGGGRLQEGFLCGAANSLHKYLPGTVYLDLSNRPVSDNDLAWLLQGLPRLRVVILGGCKKLIDPVPALVRSLCGHAPLPAADDAPPDADKDTQQQQQDSSEPHTREVGGPSAGATAAAAAAKGIQGSARAHGPSPLQALDMQRCFQLDSSALSQLLHAACTLQPALRSWSCLALSHLELKRWPLGVLPYRPRAALAAAAAASAAPAAPAPAAPAPAAASATPSAPVPTAPAPAEPAPTAPAPPSPAASPAAGATSQHRAHAHAAYPPPHAATHAQAAGAAPAAPPPPTQQQQQHAAQAAHTAGGPAPVAAPPAQANRNAEAGTQTPADSSSGSNTAVQPQSSASQGTAGVPAFAQAVATALHLSPAQGLAQQPAPVCLANNLQVLALHCCTLSEPGLITLALCCPRLQFLLLGGSTIDAPPPSTAPAPAYATQLALPREYEQALSQVRCTHARHWGDPFFESSLRMPSHSITPHDPSLHRAAPEALTAAGLRVQLRHARQHGAAVQESGASGPAGSRVEVSAAASLMRAGCVLAAAARCMHLRAVEVTFMPAKIVESVRIGLAGHTQSAAVTAPVGGVGTVGVGTVGVGHHEALSAPLQQQQAVGGVWEHGLLGSGCVQLWDLSEPEGVAGAACAQQQALAALCAGTHVPSSWLNSSVYSEGSSSSVSSSLLLGLRCAANCSNAGRFTPLHMCCLRGDAPSVRQLLQLGAARDARERSGSSALFLASYHGHAECIAVLLEAGADVQMANVAGEQPLYIASLRGNVEAVQLLLQACKRSGVPWIDPRMYGDGWSPLMAAAVADRFQVALTLLLAAGPEGVQPLLHATNKYGQTALHVAARKGSPRLLRLLMSFAGPGFVGLRDNSGETAVDVARSHRHTEALNELLGSAHAK